MEENLTKEQKAAKVYQLMIETNDMLVKKKSVVSGYNEELKRLRAEVRDLTKEDQQTFEIA